MKLRWPAACRGRRWLDLILVLALAAVAIRTVLAVLPAPLYAQRREARVWLYAASVPPGLARALSPGLKVWRANDRALLGRIVEVRSRRARIITRPGWSAPLDLLIVISAEGRYREDNGFYLGKNLPVRIGEAHALRTALGAFWGRVERITLAGG
ncbi:MAG: hypothetical protein ACM3X6_00615 [Patescibacteria group bacterium]